MINKISERIGFTPTEIKVILFLICVLFTGYWVKTFYLSGEKPQYKEFDYSKEDSLFNSLDDNNSVQSAEKDKDSSADYKHEVLALTKENFSVVKKNLPAEKSIEINKASADDFSRLPGIGKKTAEKIVEFRLTNGRYKKLSDLLKVKGIGNAKFNNLKKFLYIEPE